MSSVPFAKDLTRVEDLAVPFERYDFTICASGYEPRATWAVQWYREKGIDLGKIVALGFEGHRDSQSRLTNDSKFRTLGVEPVIVPYRDSSAVWALLRTELEAIPDKARVLVDYSSMSRTWISAIAAWFAEAGNARRLQVDWTYSPGIYKLPFIEETRIQEVRKAPGTYGGMGQFSKSLLVCSIGVDPIATSALLRYLEVHELIILHALNGTSPELDHQVWGSHDKLIERANGTQKVPLRSVARTFDFLREVAQAAIGSRNVVFAALGPKPHFLAMVMVGLSIRRVHVLHVSREWRSPAEITCDQEPILTRFSLAAKIYSDVPEPAMSQP